jgi:putative transposase
VAVYPGVQAVRPYGEVTKMQFDPEKHHRRSIRLPTYDYAGSGVYFVTICTQHREMLFGNVRDNAMAMNELGWIV